MKKTISLTFVFALLLVLPHFAFSQSAFAQSAFEFQLVNKVQRGQGKPSLTLKALEDVKNARLKMIRSDGKKRTVNLGAMRAGKIKKIYFKQPAGIFTYDLTVTGKTKAGSKMKTTFEAEVAWVDPIKLKINKELVDLPNGKLVLHTNVALASVDIEVYDQDNQIIHTTIQKFDAMRGDLVVKWKPVPNVRAVKITANDIAGFWSAMMLEPFFVDIPHQEVVFDTGKSTWHKNETPKLKNTLERIREAMEKHRRDGLKLQLYVAGYTDTVGNSSYNLKLSRSRANSIARWFRKNGLSIRIYYQGFGEGAQAVKTADNVAEEKNRRAVYLLGNTKPPISAQLPNSNWGRL